MAECVGDWQAELERVVGQELGTPVPSGRTRQDEGRISGIETGRHIPIGELMERVHEGIEVVRDYLSTLSDERRQSMGLHARRGEMSVAQIVEVFTVDHLEEHADQLDGLR